MKEPIIKEMMEQIHMPETMREEIIADLENELERHGKRRAWKLRKATVFVTVFVLAAGVASIPVQAIVQNIVRARMESIPGEEMEEIKNLLQEQKTVADSFSRAYSDSERERCKELWTSYDNGTFPQNSIRQVDIPEAVTEGELCYIWTTGEFYLPDRELTDEELLEIIDFQHEMSYAVSQGEAAREARAEMEAEQARLKERVLAAGGISETQAQKAAMDYMKSELGDRAEEMILEMIKLEDDDGQIIYFAVYGNADKSIRYFLDIDSADGSILGSD